MKLTKPQQEFIDEYLALSTDSHNIEFNGVHSGLLYWKKSPPRTKLAGKACTYCDSSQTYRVTIMGQSVPTIQVINWLHSRTNPNSIECRNVAPTVAALKSGLKIVESATDIQVDNRVYDFASLPDQEYVRQFLKVGISRDSVNECYRLEIKGKYIARFETEAEAVIAKAIIRLKKKLASELRKGLKARERGWPFPTLSERDGIYTLQFGSEVHQSKSLDTITRIFMKEYARKKQEKLEVIHTRESYEGLENVLKYDPTTGIFTWRSPKRSGQPVQANGDRAVISYEGKRLSAAKCAYYLHKDIVPAKNVKFIDGDVRNLKFDNLTTSTIRRTAGRKRDIHNLIDLEFQMQLPHGQLFKRLEAEGHLEKSEGIYHVLCDDYLFEEKIVGTRNNITRNIMIKNGKVDNIRKIIEKIG